MLNQEFKLCGGRHQNAAASQVPHHAPLYTVNVARMGSSVGCVSVSQLRVRFRLTTADKMLGSSAETYSSLFPELSGSSSTYFNPWIVSSIVLPDNTSYSFQYDVYGEVTKMTLPTGGYYTYSYVAECDGQNRGGGVGVCNAHSRWREPT